MERSEKSEVQASKIRFLLGSRVGESQEHRLRSEIITERVREVPLLRVD